MKSLQCRKERFKYDSGQSILEFAIMMPLFITMTIFLIRMSMAINAGHAFQQYTRQTLFDRLYHHADYPLIDGWSKPSNKRGGWARNWIGADQHDYPEVGPGNQQAVATTVQIERGPARAAGGESPDEDGEPFPPLQRRGVKVRVLSFICLPPKMFQATTSQSPNFVTETNNDMEGWYTGAGAGKRVRFCIDE